MALTAMFSLRPLGNVSEVTAAGAEPGAVRRWVARNGPALFDIVPPGDALPSGWVLLEGRLLRRGAGAAAKLYYDLGLGFSADQWISPSISRKGTIHELIWLPRGVRALRWQAMDSAGEFEQSYLRITSVGWVSRVVRMLRRTATTLFSQGPERCRDVGLTAWRILSDLQGAYAAAGRLRGFSSIAYRDWISRFDTLSDRDWRKIEHHIKRFKFPALLAVVIRVEKGAGPALSASLRSLAKQLYQGFFIVLVDQGGGLGELDSGPALRGRVHVVQGELTLALLDEFWGKANQGRAEQDARFVVIVDEGDRLAEHALYLIVAELQRRPDAALLYSDSDSVDADGVRMDPCFKPDWSPELLRSTNYLGGLVVYRADTLIQGDDTGVNLFSAGAQHDLALRIAEKASPEEVVHVPVVLYHRRFGVGDEDSESSIEAVRAHLARLSIGARVRESRPGCFHVRYELPEKPPLVSILIPTRDRAHLLRECVESVLGKTTYKNFELIVVDNQSRDSEALAYLASLAERPDVRLLRFEGPFNFSAINNFGVEHAQGEVLCLLNNDTEVISADWLEEMVAHLTQDRVGVVGAKLFFPDGRVQHGGDAVGPGGCADHMHWMIARDDPGYCNRAVVAQDLSAVTGACLITWKELYRQLGGLDEKNLKIAFNDVDYCLRVREAGYRVVWTPHAELYHHESVTRGRDQSEEAKKRTRREADYMRSRWRHVMQHDPFYNPNLSYERPDFSLNVAPMVERPWLRARPWWRFW
jgi:GT2 family glycosyltransferase